MFLRGPLIFMHSDEGEIQSACCCAHVGDAEQCTAQRAEVDLGRVDHEVAVDGALFFGVLLRILLLHLRCNSADVAMFT